MQRKDAGQTLQTLRAWFLQPCFLLSQAQANKVTLAITTNCYHKTSRLVSLNNRQSDVLLRRKRPLFVSFSFYGVPLY